MNHYMKEAAKIPAVRRTLNIFATLAIIATAAPIAMLTASAAPAENGCFRNNTANASMSVSGNTITAKFTVPKKCDDRNTHRVSLVVYRIADCNWQNKINNQFIFSSKTADVKTGTHTMTATLPNEVWQADLVKGNPVNIASGAEQGHILVAKVGGTCPAPTPTPTPEPTPTPTPEPTPTPTPTPETPVTAVETTPVSSEQPTKLANTGPGETAAAFFGFSALGTGVYHFFLRRRLGLDV